MSTATDMLALYIQAEKDVLKGKSVSVNGRSMTRENLQEIRAGRKEWQQRVDSETAASQGGSSSHSLVDFT